MKAIQTFVFCCAISAASMGQDLMLEMGISTARMGDMKDLQEAFREDVSEVDLVTTAKFPMYWQYGVKGRTNLKSNLELGGRVFSTSTGGRLAYEDYSGEVRFDQVLKCVGVMVHGAMKTLKRDRSVLRAYLDGGFIWSHMEMTSYLRLGSEISTDVLDLTSLNIAVEVGAEYSYFITKSLFLSAAVGYQQDFAGPLQTRASSTLVLDDDPLGADWSGIKARMGVGFRFGSRQQGIE